MQHGNDPHLPRLRQALALQKQGHLADAEAQLHAVLQAAPNHAMALHLLGVLCASTGRYAQAVQALQRSLHSQPGDATAHHNLANALRASGDLRGAQAACDEALRLHPAYVSAYCTRAAMAQQRGLPADALDDLNRALAIDPGHGQAQALKQGLLQAARAGGLQLVDRTDPRQLWPHADHPLYRLAIEMLAQRQFAPAAQMLERLLSTDPQMAQRYPRAVGALVQAKQHLCDWTGLPRWLAMVEAGLAAGVEHIQPFVLLACCDQPALQLRCAQIFNPPSGAHPRNHTPRAGGRIKVAYLSADFHEHATAHLMAGLFEQHDRKDFEWVALSFGPDDHSPMRQRLQRAFDAFVDVSGWSDAQVVDWMCAQEIDIAVDLKGHTHGARTGILKHKPAPIVVNYLGYPGTLGMAGVDYILGDPVVTPRSHQSHYSEHIAQLPDSYQVNDRLRHIGTDTPARTDEGLPAQGFVFASFNAHYKITSDVFQVWMRLLLRVPGSVLWLLCEDEQARQNLRRAAADQGVDANRLVFATRAPLSQHLARHRLADLFLDTLPCNAHTTASDALWAGLPVLTCCGQAFAGRVAASLLTAVGLPELITHSLSDYEHLAGQLATHPEQLQALQRRLRDNRDAAPLFDTTRSARHIEQAYRHMVERWRQGLPPQPFTVTPLTAS